MMHYRLTGSPLKSAGPPNFRFSRSDPRASPISTVSFPHQIPSPDLSCENTSSFFLEITLPLLLFQVCYCTRPSLSLTSFSTSIEHLSDRCKPQYTLHFSFPFPESLRTLLPLLSHDLDFLFGCSSPFSPAVTLSPPSPSLVVEGLAAALFATALRLYLVPPVCTSLSS